LDSVGRAFNVLELLVTSKPMSLSAISKQLSMSTVSAFRTLSALEKGQWVEKNTSTGLFSPGIAMLQLSAKLMSNIDIRSLSLPYLEELRSITHETTQLGIRIGLEHMFIECLQSFQQIRVVTPLGVKSHLWEGANCMAIFAFLEEEERETVFATLQQLGELVYPSGKIVSEESLRKKINIIRAKGFVASFGERITNACAVSAPIFSGKTVIASISVVGPLPRFSLEIANSYGPLVAEMAGKISRSYLKTT
jgi:DNA-binding IclR family transcriptional regulator